MDVVPLVAGKVIADRDLGDPGPALRVIDDRDLLHRDRLHQLVRPRVSVKPDQDSSSLHPLGHFLVERNLQILSLRQVATAVGGGQINNLRPDRINHDLVEVDRTVRDVVPHRDLHLSLGRLVAGQVGELRSEREIHLDRVQEAVTAVPRQDGVGAGRLTHAIDNERAISARVQFNEEVAGRDHTHGLIEPEVYVDLPKLPIGPVWTQ